ncbi:MAG: hypothetical protein HY962_07105 [Ignavibacteriae bacterium]|nr:hypothetical protein [Ignavibacteriota bacterium]
MVEGVPTWIGKLLEYGGYGAIVFVMWWFQQRMWTATLERLMTMLREERQSQMAALSEERNVQRQDMREERDRAFRMQEAEQARDYETVTRIFDALNSQTAISSSMDGKLHSLEKSVDETKRLVIDLGVKS